MSVSAPPILSEANAAIFEFIKSYLIWTPGVWLLNFVFMISSNSLGSHGLDLGGNFWYQGVVVASIYFLIELIRQNKDSMKYFHSDYFIKIIFSLLIPLLLGVMLATINYSTVFSNINNFLSETLSFDIFIEPKGRYGVGSNFVQNMVMFLWVYVLPGILILGIIALLPRIFLQLISLPAIKTFKHRFSQFNEQHFPAKEKKQAQKSEFNEFKYLIYSIVLFTILFSFGTTQIIKMLI